MIAVRNMSASSRRLLMAAGVAFAMIAGVAAPALAQDPPPAAAQPDPPDPLKFTHDRVIVYFLIAEGGTAIFEEVMAKVKQVLDKSDKPERKQQATLYKIARVEQPPQGGMVTYIALLDPVVKDASYDPFKILAEGIPPDEVRALYDKLSPVLKGISAAPIIMNIGG
jgi:hypothetical protein